MSSVHLDLDDFDSTEIGFIMDALTDRQWLEPNDEDLRKTKVWMSRNLPEYITRPIVTPPMPFPGVETR